MSISARAEVACRVARYKAGYNPEDDAHDREAGVIQFMLDVFAQYRVDSAENLGKLLGDGGYAVAVEPAREGVEAALAAMTMAAYASFETLAADLWIAAVNNHVALARKWIDKNSERQLPANVIAGYGFDVSQRMGTVLHDTKKVSFESLLEVRKAYSQAFDGVTDAVFEPLDGLIRAEKTRHLFAHRGGLIDKKFKEDMERFPEYNGAVVGERLRLTGPVTRDHINACVNAGVALAKTVDQWTLAN